MSQRLIIGLESGANWAAIKQRLVEQGADWTRDPTPAQPDVLVVSVPEDRDIDAVLRTTRELEGVRYVERDTMRFTS
jgi:hypothetical protein